MAAIAANQWHLELFDKEHMHMYTKEEVFSIEKKFIPVLFCFTELQRDFTIDVTNLKDVNLYRIFGNHNKKCS